MARKNKPRVDVAPRPSTPLQQGAFSALDGLIDSSKLAPASEPAPEPQKEEPEPPQKSRGRLVLRRETKERGGKTVVIISGFRDLPGFNAVMVGDLARALRNKLGCGGSFDRQEILLQGDRPAEVARALRDFGFRVDGVTS